MNNTNRLLIGQDKPVPFQITSNTEFSLKFKVRLRVLFGSPINVLTKIITSNDPGPSRANTTITVKRWFKKGEKNDN